MKRILHISKYYHPFAGGTEQTARDCVNALLDDYEQKVVCFNHEDGDAVDFMDGVEIQRLGCFAKISSQSLSVSYGKELKKIFKAFDPDVVIFHYPNPFAAHWILKYIPQDSRLVIYWHLDIIKQKILGKVFHGQNMRLVQRADLLIATSPNYVEGSQYLRKAIEKTIIVPSCINAGRFELDEEDRRLAYSIRKENEGKILCLAVGRHTEYKGFKYLIAASRLLDDRFKIFITGKGELTEDLKKAAEGDCKVHFPGLVSDSELKAYLSAADIFCFPSITRNEAFGLALAEAMYFERPVVTFSIPGSGVNYVSLDGVTGKEVPNRDVGAYARALTELADDSKLRERYGIAGKQRVTEKFLDGRFRKDIKRAVDALH